MKENMRFFDQTFFSKESLLVKLSFLLVLLLAITQASPSSTTVSIGNLSSATGESVTAPLLISNVDNYGTGTISISYDPMVVHVIVVANGPASTVVASNVDNDKGIVTVSAWNLGGVSGDVIFANLTFKAVGSGSTPLNISITTLKDTMSSPISAIPINGSFTVEAAQLPEPFLVYGSVFYDDGSECNNPGVNITNLNTSKVWQAETNAAYNYYQLILANRTDVNTGELLQFDATNPDGKHSNTTTHTVTSEEKKDGGLFYFNITLSVSVPKVVINEFLANPGAGNDWVELYNPTAIAVDLTGWTLNDSTSKMKSLSGSISAYEYLVVVVGSRLNQNGDTIILLNNGVVVDQVTYGTGAGNAHVPPTDKSTGRYPNGMDTDNDSADFRVFYTPTPGAPNIIPSPTIVSIAAISAPPDGSITVPIMVNCVTNLGSGTINVAYNSSVVHVTDVASGTGNALMMLTWNVDNNTGLVRIAAWDATTPHNGDVIFANVTYRAVGSEGSSSPLNITVRDLIDYNYTQIPHSVNNGTFTITTTGYPEPNITSFAPPTHVTNNEGEARTFNVTVDQVVNVSWLINGTVVKDTEKGVTEASYTNTSASVGTWNVSAIVENANGTDIQTWIWNVKPVTVTPAELPVTPFMICGRVFKNGVACNNPTVNIAIMDNGKQWAAETSATSNYFQLMLANGTDIVAGVVLRFNVTSPDGSQSNITEHTVTLEEINLGGLFDFDVMLGDPAAPKVLINEFVSKPTSPNPEWIELYNPTGGDVSLDGWTIEDGAGNSLANLNGKTLPVNGYLVFNFSNKLNDGGDIIYLSTSTTTVDKVAYGNWDDGNVDDNAPKPGDDESAGRCPNGMDTDNDLADFRIFDNPTPGAPNTISPGITSFAPPSPVANNESESRTFNITINQVVNVSWLINGTEVQTNTSVTSASYTNTSAVAGYWNVSAIAANANGSDIQTWWWTVNASATYRLKLTAAPTQQSVFENEDANYTITIKNTGNTNDTFNLTVTNTSADFAGLTKSVAQLDPGASTDVTLTVRDSSSGTYLTTVTGTSFANPSKNSSVTVTTKVFASPTNYSMRIYSDRNSQSVEQNENASYILTIENTGNQPDTYILTLYNQSGINANLNKTEIGLEKGISANVILNVSGSEVRTDYITLVTATSKNVSTENSLVTKTSIINALDLTVDASLRFVNTNEIATYILTLKNTGNKLHTFDLSTSGPGADRGTLNVSTVTLAVGQSKEILLNVSSATAGCYVVTVTAADTQDSSKTASITTTAIVTATPVYGVSLTVDKNSQSVNINEIASYVLTIKNTGNQFDTYNLTLINPRADTATLSKYVTSNLSSGASETILLGVSDSHGGSYEVKVIVESQNDPGKHDSVTTTTSVLSYGVVITADSMSKTAYVENILTFTLSVENAGNTEDSFDLTLSKQANLDTAFLSSNTTAELAPYASKDITLTIKDNTTDTYWVEIIATSQADPGKNDSIKVTAAFKNTPECGVALSVSPASKKVEKNEVALYIIHALNTGNVKDTYTINTTTGMLGKSSLTVSAGGTASTTLIMSGTEVKTYTAVVSLSSQSQPRLSETKSVSLTVIPAVSIEAVPASRTLYPGNASSVMLTIENTGTSSHTYDLSATNTSDTAYLSTHSISLARGDSADITLTINDSEEGMYTAKVTATDSADPGKKASITVSTLYQKQIVRGVDLQVDEEARTIARDKYALYVLTVKNLGNKHDTFSLNIISNETTAELSKKVVSLRASGEVGDTATVKLNVNSAEVGEYDVNVKAVSQNESSVSDIIETSTKVAGTSGVNNIVNSKVDETSTIANSNITGSTIVCSLITDSTITDSEITNSATYNSTVRDTALKDVKLENASVKAGNITSGKITTNGIIYEISKEIAIADVVTGSDEEDSSVAGCEGTTTKILSEGVESSFEIGNNRSYVGGSLKAQRSTVPTAGKSTLYLGTGEYISMDVSENIKASMEWAIINLTYDENRIPGGVEESKLRLNWYNESSDEWVRLESAGNPSWCYGAGVNTDANYVWANVSHFSEYGVAATLPYLYGAPNITSFAPSTPVSNNEDESRTFNITIDQTVNVSWWINGAEVGSNTSVTEASYTNVSAEIGTWNVSAIASNENGTDMQTWDWFVTGVPCFYLSLPAGWNLISTPWYIEPSDVQTIRVTQGLNFSICEYNTTTGLWDTPKELQPLHGYWIYMWEAGTIVFTKSIEQPQVPPYRVLKEGWNLIGPSFGNKDPLEEGLNATTVLASLRVDGYTTFSHLVLYNETTGMYTTYDATIKWEDLFVAWNGLKLYPGQGCWIGMTEDDTLLGRL